jgi:hypothetical protein
MRRNNRKDSYPSQYFRPGTNGTTPSSTTWQQGEQHDISLNGTVSDNVRDGHAIPVPPFDWQASEALMKCYNG